MKTPSNASIRRAITTLKKAEMFQNSEAEMIKFIESAMEDGFKSIVLWIQVPWHLLTPKKTRRKALKYKKVEHGIKN